jgi:phytoene synthase
MNLSPNALAVQKYDPDRFATFLFVNPDAREDLFALAAYNHEIAKTREAVSDPVVGHIRLTWWREGMRDITLGLVREHPLTQDLAELVQSGKISADDLQEMAAMRERDLVEIPNPTMADFRNYVKNTGGLLQKLLAQSLEITDPEILKAAEQTGIAWSMIGILRAVPFHAQFRRCFLPMDLLQQAGIRIERLYDFPTETKLRPVVERIADEAEACLENMPGHPRAIFALNKLTRIYIKRLRAAKYEPFQADINRPIAFKMLRMF